MIYDLVVVGGGITGSSLARRMAAGGARVLLVEQETKFRDRVRGEAIVPWGWSEAKRLGIADILAPQVHPMPCIEQYVAGELAMRRDLPSTNPHGVGIHGLNHVAVQEALFSAAAAAGAEVVRGATVTKIQPGSPATVRLGRAGDPSHVQARLVAFCAGRNPALRTELGFRPRRANIDLLMAGVLVEDLPSDFHRDVALFSNDVRTGCASYSLAQPDGRIRAYLVYPQNFCARIQGDGDFPRFASLYDALVPAWTHLAGARQAGPLASFECADVWVDQPYCDGVALVGDAASSNDPSWGQGLSLALRDVRVLSDELLADDDWNAAARRYAARHDDYYRIVSTVTGWLYLMFHDASEAGHARRARALPLITADPTRMCDLTVSGPEVPVDEPVRLRMFGEDVAAAHA